MGGETLIRLGPCGSASVAGDSTNRARTCSTLALDFSPSDDRLRLR